MTKELLHLANRCHSPGCDFRKNFHAQRELRVGSFLDGVSGLCSALPAVDLGRFGERAFFYELRSELPPERGYFIQHLNVQTEQQHAWDHELMHVKHVDGSVVDLTSFVWWPTLVTCEELMDKIEHDDKYEVASYVCSENKMSLFSFVKNSAGGNSDEEKRLKKSFAGGISNHYHGDQVSDLLAQAGDIDRVSQQVFHVRLAPRPPLETVGFDMLTTHVAVLVWQRKLGLIDFMWTRRDYFRSPKCPAISHVTRWYTDMLGRTCDHGDGPPGPYFETEGHRALWLQKHVGAPGTDGEYLGFRCTWRLSAVDPASTRLPDVSQLSDAQRAELMRQLQQHS